MCTQCRPSFRPEKDTTRRLPTPALTCSGTIWLNARISVSAMALPGVKRAMVGAGKIGLARQPFGATMVIGRVRPAFCGTSP